jgi:hypothetical protein
LAGLGGGPIGSSPRVRKKIYIYIYIERERERERNDTVDDSATTCCGHVKTASDVLITTLGLPGVDDFTAIDP